MVRIKPSDAKYRLRNFGNGFVLTKLIDVNAKDVFRFNCLRCGTCCYNSPDINPSDAARMANYLGISRKDFFREYVTMKEDEQCGWSPVLDKVGDNCVFYSKEKGKATCKVHDAKPWQCRTRPVTVTDGYSNDPETIKAVINPCRGFGRGPEQTVQQWLTSENMMESLEEEIKYVKKVMTMKKKMNRNQLREAIEKMFTE